MTHYWLLFTIFIRSYNCCIDYILSSPNKRILYCIVLLWQPHLLVNTSEGATDLPRFTWKMAVKMVCVDVF